MYFIDFLKSLLKKSPIALSKNHGYDIWTKKIIRNELSDDDNALDIGAHKGEILDLLLKYSPNGKHAAFEPIPELYNKLNKKYGARVHIHQIALSDHFGETSFHHVVTNPSYSGIKKRKYDRPNEKVDLIRVPTDKLDNIISSDNKINLIKIDVEGGEFPILKGAVNLLKRDRPILIFEHGKGGSDVYGHKPDELHKLLTIELGYSIYTMHNRFKLPLTRSAFSSLFYSGEEYYFVAKVAD